MVFQIARSVSSSSSMRAFTDHERVDFMVPAVTPAPAVVHGGTPAGPGAGPRLADLPRDSSVPRAHSGAARGLAHGGAHGA